LLTSDAYRRGRNEELIARVLKGRRDQYVVATKDLTAQGGHGKPAVLSCRSMVRLSERVGSRISRFGMAWSHSR